MKQLNLIITNCEECPYFTYNGDMEEYSCSKTGRLLFFEDYTKILNDENRLFEQIIYKNCPLEDFEHDKDK